MRHLMRIISKEFGLLIVEVKSEVNNFKICFKKETPPVQKLGMGLTIIRGFSLKLKLLILTSVVILLSIVSSSWNSEIPSKKATFTSPKKDVSTSSNVSTQPSKRQIIPLTEKRCKSLNSANGISTITVEYVAKKAGVSLRSVSLWKARYSKQIGGVCYFTFDTPKGPKTCWSSTAKSENEKVAYFMGAPNIPVLVQDPGKTPFLVVGHCNDFRPKTRN